MLKLYLDNCCYNRPFDDQTQLKILLETQAKLQVQKEIKAEKYKLVWSYILDYENGKNPFEEKRRAISLWKDIAEEYVTESEPLLQLAETLAEQGVKTYDALHIACAAVSGCDYYLTTDRKLLRAKVPGLRILDPIQFVVEQEEENNGE